MPIRDSLLAELDVESANTRKTLARVPAGSFGWAPHEKSMTMGRLAWHVAMLPIWGKMTLDTDSLDLAGPEMASWPPIPETVEELVAAHDRNVAALREALAGMADEQFMQPWSLRQGEKVFFTMPRIAVIRAMVINHLIHHRAQLGVYLRLNNVPVPSLYGPSADEGVM